MKIKERSIDKLHRNLRWHSLQLIYQIEYNGAFSNNLLNKFIENTTLSDRDQALLVQIVYGVIQRRYSLDYLLKPFIQDKQVEDWVLSLLRMSIYQIEYLDRVPNHAIVNESVYIAKINGHQGLANFVNGVLRNYLRTSVNNIDSIKENNLRLSVKYSVEPWIVDYLLNKKDINSVESILASLLEEPKISVRINPKKASRSEIIKLLEKENIMARESSIASFGIIIESGNVLDSNLFHEGFLTIQDESSMLVAPLANISGSETILDACAAPGGKATHIASLLDQGHLFAMDISASKMKKVEGHLNRMDLVKYTTLIVEDALKFIPKNNELYDIIFIDAPCSGLGLMRRKPEIKYSKKFQDLLELANIQSQMLSHLSNFLKPKGTIIYSTCTLSYEENEERVFDFIKQHSNFIVDPIKDHEGFPKDLISPEGFIRIWPDQYLTDGFFMSRINKIN